MKIFDFFKRSPRHGRARPQSNKRSYAGAAMGGILPNWLMNTPHHDSDIRQSLDSLRARSRDLWQNSDYFKGAVSRIVENVIGPDGFTLQMRCVDAPGDAMSLDKDANACIEAAFKDWGKWGNCTLDGRYSFTQFLRTALTHIIVDGEVFIYQKKGIGYSHNYALQAIPAILLDHTYHAELSATRCVRMGVELDQWGKPHAYYFLTLKMGGAYPERLSYSRTRIAADEIIHCYLPNFFDQTRGVPWAHTALKRSKMLEGYEEAALTAARVGASQMAFFKATDENPFESPDEKDVSLNLRSEVSPGSMDILPPGLELQEFKPAYPNGEMAGFMEMMLRGMASGLGLPYHELSGDLTKANYSSLREGKLVAVDKWKSLQNWFIAQTLTPLFENWLRQYLLTSKFPAYKFDKFNAPKWYPRTWDWVDPDKAMRAIERKISLGVVSRTQIIAEMGRDCDDVFNEIAKERETMNQLNIPINDIFEKDEDDAKETDINKG